MSTPTDTLTPSAQAQFAATVAEGAQTLTDLPPELIAHVQKVCHLTADQVSDILEAVKLGITTTSEYLGVTPAVANTIESLALEFYRQKHTMHANTLYAFLIEMDPNRATAWRGVGACQQSSKFYPMAVLAYQRALTINPDDVISTILLGECLYLDGWRDEAVRALERGVAMGANIPAHAVYIKRAQAILRIQAGGEAASGGPADTKKKSDAVAAYDSGPTLEELTRNPAPMMGLQPGADLAAQYANVDIQALLAMDNAEFANHPVIADLATKLSALVKRTAITIKDIAGFTDEQMYGGYVAACRYIDMGQPLTALKIIGWLIHFDSRNGSYYQVAGIAAQHAKLYCFADYLYGLSLIYDKDNATTMLYRGEVKIYSFERNAGVQLIREAVEKLATDPESRHLVKRGKSLIKQFEKKQPSQRRAKGVRPSK